MGVLRYTTRCFSSAISRPSRVCSVRRSIFCSASMMGVMSRKASKPPMTLPEGSVMMEAETVTGISRPSRRRNSRRNPEIGFLVSMTCLRTQSQVPHCSGIQHLAAGHPAHHFLAGIAGEPFQALIHVGDHQVRVHHEEGDGEILQDAGQGGDLQLDHRMRQQFLMLPEHHQATGGLIPLTLNGGGGHRQGGAAGPTRLGQNGGAPADSRPAPGSAPDAPCRPRSGAIR